MLLRQALETGYRHLDCASMYGNQELVGQGIKKWIEADPSKNKREDLFVTSKVCLRALMLVELQGPCL